MMPQLLLLFAMLQRMQSRHKIADRLNKFQKIISILSAAVIGLHLAFRKNFPLMQRLSEDVVAPIRRLQTRISARVPFSLAEFLIALALIWFLYRLTRKKWKKLIAGLVTLGLFVYGGFCFFWGNYYYGDPGITAYPVSEKQLKIVTRYFASMANDTYREEPDREEIIAKSAEMNGGIGCKKIACSKVMSLIDFSGFFFPFTGEANVNMDMPAHELASTCAHELCHLNGISREQDANFCAVKDSLAYGDPDYVYSAALMAYTYLGNALHDADAQAWREIYDSLHAEVKEDLNETNEYWEKFETPVRKVSNTVYEGFLYSYDQKLGLKSYGACVDLLVNYYYPEAVQALS